MNRFLRWLLCRNRHDFRPIFGVLVCRKCGYVTRPDELEESGDDDRQADYDEWEADTFGPDPA